MDALYEVNDDNFEETVLRSPVPVLVDFSAEWCGPCKAAVPLLLDVEREYEGEAKLVTVDVDKSPTLRDQFNIRSVPTLILFRGGELLERQVGVPARTTISALIDRGLEASK